MKKLFLSLVCILAVQATQAQDSKIINGINSARDSIEKNKKLQEGILKFFSPDAYGACFTIAEDLVAFATAKEMTKSDMSDEEINAITRLFVTVGWYEKLSVEKEINKKADLKSQESSWKEIYKTASQQQKNDLTSLCVRTLNEVKAFAEEK